jgi:hypothetical protein
MTIEKARNILKDILQIDFISDAQIIELEARLFSVIRDKAWAEGCKSGTTYPWA